MKGYNHSVRSEVIAEAKDDERKHDEKCKTEYETLRMFAIADQPPSTEVVARFNETCPHFYGSLTGFVLEAEGRKAQRLAKAEKVAACTSEYNKKRSDIVSGIATEETIDQFNRSCPPFHLAVPEVLAQEHKRKQEEQQRKLHEEQLHAACISEYGDLKRAILAGGQAPGTEALARHNTHCPEFRVERSQLCTELDVSDLSKEQQIPERTFVAPQSGCAQVNHEYNMGGIYFYILLPGESDTCAFPPQKYNGTWWGVLDCLKAGRKLFFVVSSGPHTYLLKKEGKRVPNGPYITTVKSDKMCLSNWGCYQVLAEIRPVK